MSQFRKWINPDNTEKNWTTTIYWLILLGILWIFAMILIFEIEVNVSSDVTLLLTAGIGSYFIGKTASDAEKEQSLKNQQAVKTTLGLRPRVSRGIFALSLLIIYTILILKEASTTGTLTLFIEPAKYDAISALFWAVVGFYLPFIVPFIQKMRE